MYGYVGRAYGISDAELWVGNWLVEGDDSMSDRAVIEAGMRLWDERGLAVSRDDVMAALRELESTFLGVYAADIAEGKRVEAADRALVFAVNP